MSKDIAGAVLLLFIVGYAAAGMFGYKAGASSNIEIVNSLSAELDQHIDRTVAIEENLSLIENSLNQETDRANSLLEKNKQLTDTWQKLVFMLQQSCKQRERVVINGAEYHCHPAKTTPTLELQQPKRNQEDRA